MPEHSNVKDILVNIRQQEIPELPEDLVLRIYGLEDKVQFDEHRSEVVSEIKRIVQAAIEEGLLKDRGAL